MDQKRRRRQKRKEEKSIENGIGKKIQKVQRSKRAKL